MSCLVHLLQGRGRSAATPAEASGWAAGGAGGGADEGLRAQTGCRGFTSLSY